MDLKEKDEMTVINELKALCSQVRDLIEQHQYNECNDKILESMRKYPNAPQPHNLLGVLLEKKGDKVMAMKHFRAAYALDPTYLPTRHNLDLFSEFYPSGEIAYDEQDCPPLVEHSNHLSKKE